MFAAVFAHLRMLCRRMGKRENYAPGTFSWVDLATTDTAAAKSFYSGLFGWEMKDGADGGGVGYVMCRMDGDVVCGLFEMSEDRPATGAPPNWISYVTVADADAAVERAQELGGSAIGDGFDVLDAGRIAVLRDPQGAVFAVWQPQARIGAERVNDVGCLCMNELVTTDVDAARSFYEGLFGWTTELIDMGTEDAPAGFVRNRESINASFFAGQPGVPPHWRPCFTVASTETGVTRVRELGGNVLREPVQIGDGSLAVVRDPQDAVFALYAGQVDP